MSRREGPLDRSGYGEADDEHPEREWAIRTLAPWLREGDAVPEWFRAACEEVDDAS